MKRIEARMLGGMVISTILTLIVITIIFEMLRGRQMRHSPQPPTPTKSAGQEGGLP